MKSIRRLSGILFAIIIGVIFTACNNPVYTGSGNDSISIQPTIEKSIGGYVISRPYITEAARDYNLQPEYDSWKQKYIVDLGNGQMRVQRDAASNYDTVSEGIGYGMLLAVYFNDKNVFDGLYNYCKAHFIKDEKTGVTINLMHWKIDNEGNNVSEFADYKKDTTGIVVGGSSSGPSYSWSQTATIPHGYVYGNLTDGTVWILPPPPKSSDTEDIKDFYGRMKDFLDNSSNYYLMAKYDRSYSTATDADEDIAAALCFASKVWRSGYYSSEATKMITAIKGNDFSSDGFIKNGNKWGTKGIWNPSYFAPAYYLNLYALQCPDQRDFWTKAYNNIYDEMNKLPTYVKKTYGRSTCMYPDWWDTSASDGTIKKANSSGSDRFYYNNGTSGTGPALVYPYSAMWEPGTSKSDYTTQGKMSFNSFYDAIRVPWRIMNDYIWDVSGSGKVAKIISPLYYAYAVKATTIVDGYSISCGAWNWDDRDGFNTTVGGKNHSTSFIAMSACIGMILGRSDIWDEVVNHPETDTTFNYYGNTLRLLSMLMLSGKYENLYNAPPASGTMVRIKNKWQGRYLNIEDLRSHTVECSDISKNPGQWSAQWILTRNNEGYYLFRNKWIPYGYENYLHTEDQLGTAEWDTSNYNGNPNTGWWSAQWILEQANTDGIPDGYRFKNRWTGTYLHIENLISIDGSANINSVQLQNTTLTSGWNGDSAKWYIEIVQ